MPHNPLITVIAISAAAVAMGSVPAAAKTGAGSKAVPPATYRSLERLPDWSGWWYLDLPPNDIPAHFLTAPFRLEVRERLRAATAPGAVNRDGTGETEKALQCRPPNFDGFNGGFAEDIEFLFTPGRVTLTNESGLIRRIFTDGSPSTNEIDATNAGISSGRWEGKILVVETHGLNPDAVWGPRWPGAPRLGHNARTRERIYLRDSDTLEIDLHMEAPALLATPFDTTFVYKRHPGHQFHEQVSCVDSDRSIDRVSGKEQFDLTPPADLPPPPQE